MRKKDKNQILELVGTLEEADKLLLSTISKIAEEELITMLSDQQEAVISIGNQIEELEGEGTEAVEILEKYCDTLWQISQETESIQRKQGMERLLEYLCRVKDEIINMHQTLDVVFLPYKASMWDCMETVWKAADEDPDCNAYVIPIPYFDMKPDGTAGEMHCENEMMPEYVPTISYLDYDIEKEHPDIIYIHNPYDQYNKVTSVHPDFYSSVLKDHTDMLVYIPYYLTTGRLPEAHGFLPAYVYADKVILQNEEMIEDIDPDIPREKFLPLGSPKEERLIWMETHKEQLDFPEEWKKRVRGRKVILYNLSISGLLKERDKILDKMEEVFSLLSRRDDILLLLRPHPLLEATLTSMCEELVEKYKKLISYFKKHNIGIIDQTPDPDMAVVFADAYMGELTSSIVDMFRVLNKPRFFLTNKKFYQMTPDEMKAETTFDVCRIGDELWFVTDHFQLLCKLSLQGGKIEVVAELPEVPVGNSGYISLVNYEDKIILTPFHADALCIYDMTKQSFEKRYFKDEYVHDRFSMSVLYKHYLFLVPRDYPAIIRYDIVEGSFIYHTQCIADMLEMVGDEEGNSPFSFLGSYKEKIYICTNASNAILCFHMDTGEYSIHKVGNETNTYRVMVADGEYCWLIMWNSPNIVKWNPVTGETWEFDKFPCGFEAGSIPFKYIMDFDSSIYLVPFYANRICKLNKETGEITFAEFELPYKEGTYQSEYYDKKGAKYHFAKKITEKQFITLSYYDNSLMILNADTKKYKKIPIRIENYVKLINRRTSQNLRELKESDRIPISKFLEYITLDLFDANRRRGAAMFTMDQEQQTGSKIHTEIKNTVIHAGE